MSLKSFLSVGIDIGTTSMHLSISRLWLTNVSKAGEPERLVITRREGRYESPVCLTPLCADGTIDADAISTFVIGQYKLAGLDRSDIASGAVIVTGETAKIRNAEAVVEKLAGLAGEFVAASAGPNFESVLAGRGSGAGAYSEEHGTTVCNVDVGGGTTNIAIFERGQIAATSAVALGGRLVCLNEKMEVLRLSTSAEFCLEVLNITTRKGEALAPESAQLLADYAARTIVDALTIDEWKHPLLLTDPLLINKPIKEFWFSGGVAELMSSQSVAPSGTEYGDLGNFLAAALLTELERRCIPYKFPADPIRATVKGASVHSVQVSGSTVDYGTGILPVRSLPVVEYTTGHRSDRPGPGGPPDGEQLARALSGSMSACDLDWTVHPVAISLPGLGRVGYSALQVWAAALTYAFETLQGQPPLVVLCSHDLGSALGQCLRALNPSIDVVCLDGVAAGDVTHGAYVDIGTPLAGGRAVPVVLRTMVFDT